MRTTSGLWVGIAAFPELGDEVVPAALRELEEDLALLLGDDVADLVQEVGVGRGELAGLSADGSCGECESKAESQSAGIRLAIVGVRRN